MTNTPPVFRVVNGKEIQISAADLKRPHRTVVDAVSGAVRLIELTDEEMAEQEAAKEAWDAGEPERKERERREAEEQERFLSSLRYEKRLVAFIDILGWSEAVQSSAKEGEVAVKALGEALVPLKAFTNYTGSLGALMPETGWHGDPVMTHFSDCVVLTVKDDISGRQHLLQALSVLSLSLVHHGFLLRGGIARGDVYHRNGMVFGPALIEAYELERDVACAPRVILSEELSKEFKEWGSLFERPWREDCDGLLFFNFLPPFLGNRVFQEQTELWQRVLLPVRELIIKQALRYRERPKIFSKYRWLARYFDEVCAENPQCGLSPVSSSL